MNYNTSRYYEVGHVMHRLMFGWLLTRGFEIFDLQTFCECATLYPGPELRPAVCQGP